MKRSPYYYEIEAGSWRARWCVTCRVVGFIGLIAFFPVLYFSEFGALVCALGGFILFEVWRGANIVDNSFDKE